MGTVYSNFLVTEQVSSVGAVIYTCPDGIRTVVKEVALTNRADFIGVGLAGCAVNQEGFITLLDITGVFPIPHVTYRTSSRFTLDPGTQLFCDAFDPDWEVSLMGFQLVLP